MSDVMKVNIDSLKKLAEDLEKKRKVVVDSYEKKLKTIIIDNAHALDVQGITSEKEQEKIVKLVNDFDKCIGDLIDVLNNKIIPNYEETKDGINLLFSNELLENIGDLLKDE